MTCICGGDKVPSASLSSANFATKFANFRRSGGDSPSNWGAKAPIFLAHCTVGKSTGPAILSRSFNYASHPLPLKLAKKQAEAWLPLSGRGARGEGDATLTFNAEGHFECRWVNLAPVSQACIWTKDLEEQITCPIAHGEGNFQLSSKFPLSSFIENDQVALTYIYPDGAPANGDYPFNPNGSILDIAGICNPQGNVLGLMPHPENHIFTYQHPRHTRGETGNSGLSLFENGVKYASAL